MSTESHASPPPRPCRKCGSVAFKTRQHIHKNGTEHIRRECAECNAYIDNAAQEFPPGMFVMPFGKHQGKSLDWIVENDRAYVDWFMKTPKKANISRRFAVLIGKNKKTNE